MIDAKHQHRPAFLRAGRLLAIFTLLIAGGGAAMGQTATPLGDQAITLKAGWNAIWLEVEPLYAVGDTVRGADPA